MIRFARLCAAMCSLFSLGFNITAQETATGASQKTTGEKSGSSKIVWGQDGQPRDIKLSNGDTVSFSAGGKDITHIEVVNANAAASVPGLNLGKMSFDFKNGSLKSGALKTFGTLGTSVTGGKEVVITFPTGQRVSTAKVGGVGAYYENFKEAVKPAVADIREATEIAQHDGHSGWAFDVKQFEHELRFDQGSGH